MLRLFPVQVLAELATHAQYEWYTIYMWQSRVENEHYSNNFFCKNCH